MKKVVPILMLAGVASLLLSLVFGGFIVYQWVLACETTAASIALFAYWARYYHDDSHKPGWPPLLPLSIIGASGGAKSFFVATGRNTPWPVVAILLAAVVWFCVMSWKMRKAGQRIIGEG